MIDSVNKQKHIAVVLCGGSGSRLWPLSRASLPKPFIPLVDAAGEERDADGANATAKKSLLEMTYARLSGGGFDAVITITHADYRFLCADAYRGSGISLPHTVLAEPFPKNTAPAIATAACFIREVLSAEAILTVLPADHIIMRREEFIAHLSTAHAVAEAGYLVTLGIRPTHPSSAYGYIRHGDALATNGAFNVDTFVEKPERQKAESYLADGNYDWNAGIFVMRAQSALDAFATHAPAVSSLLQQSDIFETHADHLRIRESYFSAMPADSFDYMIMEKCANAAVVRSSDIGWSDIGSWESWRGINDADARGNVAIGNVRLYDTDECIIYDANDHRVGRERLIVTHGVRGLCIIDTPDALLVADSSQSERVREVYADLAEHTVTQTPSTVHRPWGSFTVLSESARHKVKRIDVQPGAKLSLQSHQHRSEHWTCVAGAMDIVIDEEHFTLAVNQSCFIPEGARHRMINNTAAAATIIEVQVGNYLGEDDITRYEDSYGRT